MHNMVATSNRISCMSMHWATTKNQPNQTEKKKPYTMAPLNHMHKGRCSYFTILKVAAVSSTTTTIKPSWSVLNISNDGQAKHHLDQSNRRAVSIPTSSGVSYEEINQVIQPKQLSRHTNRPHYFRNTTTWIIDKQNRIRVQSVDSIGKKRRWDSWV